MVHIQHPLKPGDFVSRVQTFWKRSAEKLALIHREFDDSQGSPVLTVNGKYTARGWTEWTQGFQFGSAVLQFEATGDSFFLEQAKKDTIGKMAPHVSHTGVHDHGFNNISTYGNLLRLMNEGKMPYNEWEKHFYELALKISGAVQASRWTGIRDGGFIYSFNGPHSLFVDTIRSCRILMMSHLLGHVLQGENDAGFSLFDRSVQHLAATARYSVYYGEGRDRYDIRGRVAHESIFNTNDGSYRCASTQQGYSGFSTWTRGLAWAMLGFSEELELLDRMVLKGMVKKEIYPDLEQMLLKAAQATCDFYIGNTPSDGIPYWDTGAPELNKLGNYLDKPADPFNGFEPVDSSAASIAAQGLMRLGQFLLHKNRPDEGGKYWQAGLKIMDTLLDKPYLNTNEAHMGLILHSVYHRPNGWDFIPEGQRIPCGESSMWGDYHAREAVLYLQRFVNNEVPYAFFNGLI
jgi:unsaturated chondroitin disaccharide hydrolase